MAVGLFVFPARAPAQRSGEKPPAADVKAGLNVLAGGSAAVEATQEKTVKEAVKSALPPVRPLFRGTRPGGKGAGAQAAVDEAAERRLAMLRRKSLKDEDFVENEEKNRDPFRSYLKIFTTKEGPATPKVPAIFEKFAIEELDLIAIVSGDAHPRAMFRDPGGLGQTVKRGDYLSKSGARLSKILSDRVLVEMNEVAPTGEARILEKAILIRPEAEGEQK